MARATIFLMLAMVAALLAAMVVFSALKRREAEMRGAMGQNMEIVVAARDIPLGTKIEAGAVKLARWSRELKPEGAFTDPAAVIGGYAIDGFVAGEPIVPRKLVGAGEAASVMPLLIPPGMRAMSVAVDEVSDIAGFVKPHTRVDVLVTASGAGAGGKPLSKIVLQNVEVLAIAQQLGRTKNEPEVVRVVTLLLTPHQAEKLALASREGSLRLVMRNYRDDRTITTAGTDISDLFGWAAAPAFNAQSAEPVKPRAQLRAPFAIEIMRDGKSSETVSFVNGEPTPATPAPHAGLGQPATRAAPAPAGAPDTAALATAAPAPPPASKSSAGSAAAYMPAPKTIELP